MQAMECFQKASRHHEEVVAKAYLLREEAQAVRPDDENSAIEHRRAFTAAAKAFIESAASAMEKATYYRIAAECFRECGNLFQAAQSYIDAGEFDSGAQLYRDDGKFSQAIQVVRKYRSKMHHDVVDRIELACRLHYFRNFDLTYVCRCLIL